MSSNPEDNPWKTISSRYAYENPWMKVREDRVTRPDGTPGMYAMVEKCAAAGVVAIAEDGDIYLVGQYRYTLNSYSWEIIEGGVEPGEEPLGAAKRELREEAGLEASYWEPLLGGLHLSNCISSEEAFLFLAKDLVIVPAEPEVTEVLQIKKQPLADCLAMIENGQITDAMSVIALMQYSKCSASRL